MPSQSKQTESYNKRSLIDSFSDYYSQHMIMIWLIIVFVPIIIIAIGWIVLPEVFYDQFIWRYFWGTIEVDAQEESYGDVTEAYNPVNTIIYAFIVIAVLYWIYKIFKKYQIELDFKFFIAIIPFILVGSFARALEDAELFTGPVVYWFIAPIIYILTGVVVLGLILIGVGIRNYSKITNLRNGSLVVVGVFFALDIIYLITYFFFSDQFSYMLDPTVPVILSIIIFIVLLKYMDKIKQFEISTFLFSIGLWFLLINIIVLCQWQTIHSWTEAYSAANPDNTVIIRPYAFLLVIGLTLFGVSIVYIIAKLLIPKYPKLTPFLFGTNLILFFGHFLDASATFVAIDYYGYVEKHVLPTFLIEIFQTAAIMYLLKAIIIILVIYFIDILYEKDFQKNPILSGLVKIAVLVLGLGPGFRDVLRLAIGV